MTRTTLIDIQSLGRSLYARREDGVITKFASGNIGDWVPTQSNCHGNVSTWCEYFSEHNIVRGWLYFSFDGLLPFVRFTAHSVVQDENGELVDITPSNPSQPYPFIRANEDEDTYSTLISEQKIMHIDFDKQTGTSSILNKPF